MYIHTPRDTKESACIYVYYLHAYERNLTQVSYFSRMFTDELLKTKERLKKSKKKKKRRKKMKQNDKNDE